MRALAAVVVLLGVPASATAALLPSLSTTSTRYGYVEFPKDEHQHLDGLDYWWGSADLVMQSGNRYIVGFAFDSFFGYGVSGHQIFPRQGPYEGRAIMTQDGPAEWGHDGEPPNLFVRKMSVYAPLVSERFTYSTLSPADGLKDIGRLERTTLSREAYRMRIDNSSARVHPGGQHVKAVVDLDMEMRSPPLLLGGTGRWWYGLPEDLHYPSRSFQYMQAAKRLTGTLELQQPDGSILRETVVPERSRLVSVHEYDATPEDIAAGFVRAEATQIHPRYAQYYHSGMPWDLIFVDLDNGAQLMVAMLSFHETEKGTLTPLIGPDMATYDTMATLRLPSGKSVVLDDRIHVEHLNYRRLVGRVPTAFVSIQGLWTQTWDHRVSHPGGTLRAGDGTLVRVPPFDLAVVPAFTQAEPAVDERGNGLTQRVPFEAHGWYDRCPVHGAGWSELIVNWYGKEHLDPWWTGGGRPIVPDGCRDDLPTPPAGMPDPSKATPDFGTMPPPDLRPEGCTVFQPGPSTRCEYTATIDGGIGGMSVTPGGWTVTIARPGRDEPIVVTSLGGQEMYACGAIRPDDHVVAEVTAPGGVVAGNPGICF